MNFQCETVYQQKALTAMARALRKTIRKKNNIRSRVFGIIIVVLAIMLVTPSEGEVFVFDIRVGITLLAALAVIVVFFIEDWLNGYIARKRILPGTEKSLTVFEEDGYHSTSDFGKSEWTYDKILMLAETKEYLVFIFNICHAQVYEKANVEGGSLEEFKTFLSEKTDKKIQKV